MGLDLNKTTILYSAGTQLAYKIAEKYYNNIHYVWCTTTFNSMDQPPTSNPATICRRYLEQIKTGDRHAAEIDNNIKGILKGAKAKRDSGVITEEDYTKIRATVSVAEYEVFFPVLYIVDAKKVKDRCEEVPEHERASDNAVEYKITDLTTEEFQIVSFRDILMGIVSVSDKRVGE